MNDQNFDPFRDLKLFIAIMLFVLSILSRTVEVFIRRTFGERFLQFPIIFLTFIAIMIVNGMNTVTNPLTGQVVSSGYLQYFAWAFVIAAIYHQARVFIRNYKGEDKVHSYFMGYSWGIWYRFIKPEGFLNRIIPGFINRVAEPLLVFVIGSLMHVVDHVLGAYLQVAAVALFMQMGIQYRKERTRALDENDAKIDAGAQKKQYFNGAASKPPATGKAPKQVDMGKEWA